MKTSDMKKPKLKLQPFEIKDTKELSAEFLSKILGGDTDTSTDSTGSNSPAYSISAQSNTEVETSKEN